MRKQVIGYTCGVYDMFHVGHVNLFRSAKGLCDTLIVAVTTDQAACYKNKNPIISFEERIEVVRACRYVDLAIPQASLDKIEAWEKLKFHKLFVGDDWYKNEQWNKYEEALNRLGAEVIYFPYTPSTSSSLIRERLKVCINDI
jgi:glycerol-3-phosphate cytidylyltransferase